ncbi:hypothetical protein [Qipengyuania sp. ASV99]|uniref:hypothetical protein n=1 Tax=Qipengyuania sp. ASV99 TaxID=3399681 RepID=UPI003A4C655C
MSFALDAGLFVHQIDLASDRALLVAMSEADYRAASFLDNRLLQPQPGTAGAQPIQRPMQWAGWSDLAAQTAAAPAGETRNDAQFIFHIGHVGSTLIARLLGEASDTLALREPQILRQFAELKGQRGLPHSPWSPEDFDRRLNLARQWLARTFRPDQRALIKATSFASEIAPDLLAGRHKAVFLMLSPERYLQTILAGENSRAELAVLSGPRLERLHRRLDSAPFKLWELGEAQRAALSWACEMTALESAASDNVRWVDFDAFLAQPAEMLAEIAAFLNIAMPAQQAQALVAGPIMQQYSKAPEHGYSPQLREEVLAGAAADYRQEIHAALEWLDAAARDHAAIERALTRAKKG